MMSQVTLVMEDFALAELLEARGRSAAVADLVGASTFTHVENPDDLDSDFFSNIAMLASMQVNGRFPALILIHPSTRLPNPPLF